jgi:outer membrane protein assembly factor BamB
VKYRFSRLLIALLVLLLCGWAGAQLLAQWMQGGRALDVVVSNPGMDGGPSAEERAAVQMVDVNLAGQLETFVETPLLRPTAPSADVSARWPNFRGADFDNIVKSEAVLADAWPDSGPEELWSVELGEGHAAPAVLDGLVYLLDYDEAARADALRCFSLEDGTEIWRRSYSLPAKRNHGLSRTIPAVTEQWSITMGPRCHVSCVDTESGELLWGIDLQKEYGTTEPLWFTGQCPLIDDGLAILAPSGTDVLMMAVDCASGEVVWSVPNARNWKMSHSSIMPMTIHGEDMFVYAAVGGIAGVSKEGELLWDIPWSASVVAPSPILLDDNRVFITAGYGAGSLMFQVEQTAEGYTARELAKNGPKDWLASEQQTPILYDGLLYGIMPKDAGALKQQFVCYDPDSGELVWSSGKTHRFGLGPYILADGKFYILDDDGTLTMIALSRSGYEPLAQFKVLDGHDAWGPFAVVGTRMLLRDSTRMVCIELGEGK